MTDQDQAANKWQKIAEEAQQEETAAEAKASDAWEAMLADMSPEEKVEALIARMVDVQEAANTAEDRVMRTMAEMENLRRRTERDIDNARKYAVEKLLKELLAVVDSMDRGLQALPADDKSLSSARDGLSMTRDMMLKVLESQGVSLIAPEVGKSFDPNLHEAVSMQAQEGMGSKEVVNVLQPGYQLNGRVVRAAMVIVTP